MLHYRMIEHCSIAITNSDVTFSPSVRQAVVNFVRVRNELMAIMLLLFITVYHMIYHLQL